MDVQQALYACLFTNFIYENWNTVGRTTLNGLSVIDSQGNPVFPGKNFTVTKTIYCNDLATELNPERPLHSGWKIIGIVAVNDSNAKDAVIAVRGTSTIWEWIQNARFWPRPFTNVPGSGLTEDGFTAMYQSFSFTAGPSRGPFMAELLAELPSNSELTITGHSMGAAVATLLTLDLTYHSHILPVLYTIASPRVGDLFFHKFFNHAGPICYRVENRNDLVPKIPPPGLYEHVGQKFELLPPS